MATTYSTREQALAGLTKQKDEARIALNKAIREKGITDSRDIIKLPEFKKMEAIDTQLRGVGTIGEIGTGMMSTVIGGVTGIPDLLSPGLNWAKNNLFSTGSQYKDIPQLYPMAMEAAGVPSAPTSEQATAAFYGPDVALGAYGIASLLKSGFKGAKSYLKDRKVKAFTDSLPPDEANIFKDFMLKGQGSSDPRMAAVLQKLSSNPEYAEIFSTLQSGATKAATAGMVPRPSRISEPEAAKNLVSAVEERLKAVRTARSQAGNENFTKAIELGGDRAILTPSKTINKIDELLAQIDTSSDSGKAAVKYLQETRDSIAPRIKVEGRQGTQYIVDEGIKGNTLAGTPAGTRIENRTITTYDSLGMPQTKTVQVEIPYMGSPSVTSAGKAPTIGTIPGSTGYTIQQNPKALTVQEVQARLKDWGRNAASEGGVVRDLAVSDEVRISKALFGAMKDDLSASTKAATSVADKRALGALEKARSQTSKASQDYNTLVAQGIPDFLKGKNVSDVSFEQLSGAYGNLNPAQRAVFREWVGQNKAESLQAIDRDVFQAFKNKHTTTLSDGTIGTDLKSMAEDWAKLSIKEKDALALSLGQNVNEFNGRMKDALVFTRRMSVGQPIKESVAAIEGVGKDLARVGGATAGYSVYQGIQLGKDAIKALVKTGLNDEETMRLLLTPEGASFLKNAAMSPASTKTLEALTAVKAAELPPTFKSPYMGLAAAGAANKAIGFEQPAPEGMPAIPEGTFPEIPAGVFEAQPTEAATAMPEGMPAIPEGVFGAPVSKFASTPAEKDRAFVLNNELKKATARLQAAATPEEKMREQGDIDALNNEIGRLK